MSDAGRYAKACPESRGIATVSLVWRIPTVVFLFNQFNSVYQIRPKVTRRRLIMHADEW